MKKLALVTGGGRGLGAAICRELAEAGYDVLAADVKFGDRGVGKQMTLDLSNEG